MRSMVFCAKHSGVLTEEMNKWLATRPFGRKDLINTIARLDVDHEGRAVICVMFLYEEKI